MRTLQNTTLEDFLRRETNKTAEDIHILHILWQGGGVVIYTWYQLLVLIVYTIHLVPTTRVVHQGKQVRPCDIRISFFLVQKWALFTKGKKTYPMRLKTEHIHHKFLWTPVWHGDLDHSDLRNDQCQSLQTEVQIWYILLLRTYLVPGRSNMCMQY